MVIMRLIEVEEFKDYITVYEVIEIVERGGIEYEFCESK